MGELTHPLVMRAGEKKELILRRELKGEEKPWFKIINIMSENQPHIITAIINQKEEKIDKNRQTYLLLRLENGEVVLVFPNQVPKNKWEELKTGEKYELIIKENQLGYQLLVEFEGEGMLIW
jgi:hypothetical protein